MSDVLLVCLDADDAEAIGGRTYALWDRERDASQFYAYEPGPGYYEAPFPDPSIFDGVESVVYSTAAMAAALDFLSPYGEEVRARFRWFADKGRWL